MMKVISNILLELEDKERGLRKEYHSRITALIYYRRNLTVVLNKSEAKNYFLLLKALKVGLEDLKIEKLCKAMKILEIKLK